MNVVTKVPFLITTGLTTRMTPKAAPFLMAVQPACQAMESTFLVGTLPVFPGTVLLGHATCTLSLARVVDASHLVPSKSRF